MLGVEGHSYSIVILELVPSIQSTDSSRAGSSAQANHGPRMTTSEVDLITSPKIFYSHLFSLSYNPFHLQITQPPNGTDVGCFAGSGAVVATSIIRREVF